MGYSALRTLFLTLLGGTLLFTLVACEEEPEINDEFCKDHGLEYKEKDGVGYCYKYKKGDDVLIPVDMDCTTAEDGTPCDDEDACTYGDVCQASSGTCVGSPILGIDDDNPCTQDSCDPDTGTITYDPGPANGNSCNDGDVCSANDQCQNGLCRGDYTIDANGDPIDDQDACTLDRCDSSGLRQNTPLTAAQAVASGLGGLQLADIANPCALFVCQVGTGDSPHVDLLDAVSCADPAAGRSDGACVTWTCQTGTCAATIDEQVVADATISGGDSIHPSCRMRECNTQSGEVTYAVDPRLVDGSCDDDNPCTYDDSCQMDGSCLGRELAHGTACNDANPCTIGDYCHQNTCRPGVDYLALALQTSDPENPDQLDPYRDPAGIIAEADPCREYTCDPILGVLAVNLTGNTCDDGNPCTSSSSCQEGECVGARDDSNDGQTCAHSSNPCLAGYCDKGVCINFQGHTDGRSCNPGELTGDLACQSFVCSTSGLCEPGGADSSLNGQTCAELGECAAGVCADGTCEQRLDYRDGQPCGAHLDPRCNSPRCNDMGLCEPFPATSGDTCILTADDLAQPSQLACMRGECLNLLGNMVCTPVVANEGQSCDDNNPCNGADFCQNGSCVEEFISTSPNDPAPMDAECQGRNCFDNLLPTAAGPATCNVDGNAETIGVCQYSGRCIEITQVVDDVNDCTMATWNEVTGQLVLEQKDNGVECHVVNINPCIENLGTCIDGECHTNPMPDGSACDVVALSVPEGEDLPVGHDSNCYSEVCIAGECTINTERQNGGWCDDGDTLCTFPGTCMEGACTGNTTPRGYGDICVPGEGGTFVDPNGNPLAAKDLGCWARTECSESGTCSVKAAMVADHSPCDFAQDGDNCDGECLQGICLAHDWEVVHANHMCPDTGNDCTYHSSCNLTSGELGDCTLQQAQDHTASGECSGVDPNNPCATMVCLAGACTSSALPRDGAYPGCEGPSTANPCAYDECRSGVCTEIPVNPAAGVPCTADSNPCTIDRCALQDPQNPQSAVTCQAFVPGSNEMPYCEADNNPCTLDRCAYIDPQQPTQGATCNVGDFMEPQTPCGEDIDDSDDNCVRGVCTADGNGGTICTLVPELWQSPCAGDPDNTCVGAWECGGDQNSGSGVCTANWNRDDGTSCDTNGIPCDEACVDQDGPDGDLPSTCQDFATYYGLLSASTLALSNDDQQLCRKQYDPTYDPETDPGHSCARYVCYFGKCHPWDDNLPEGLINGENTNYGDGYGIYTNPTNGNLCGESGECTNQGRCDNNVCTNYHHLEDGTLCGESTCGNDQDEIYQPTCEAGACVDRPVLQDSCSRGQANCLSSSCSGGDCPMDCFPFNFDYVSVFEDISYSGDPRRSQLRSPYDTTVTCPSFRVAAPMTEGQRLACDDGSIMLNLKTDLGLTDFAFAPEPGFEFYNRRYEWISISANGTVLLHRHNPASVDPLAETLFVDGNVGGTVLDPDAFDTPGDPTNNGENAAKIQVFRDDLSFVSDIDVDPATIPSDPLSQTAYGAFTTFGEIYTKVMPGPDGAFGQPDDYLIVQWDDASFYGCAQGSSRSRMTLQMKWWPLAGHIVFAYPQWGNDDGIDSPSPYCLPGRVHGSDATIGLTDENGAPSNTVGANGWLLHNNSGPTTDSFDAYFIMWPTDRPITNYAQRGQEWFVDLTEYDAQQGTTIGNRLDQVSNCNDCCQRVEFDRAIFIDGQPRNFMYICVDGYIHFTEPDHPDFAAASLNNDWLRMYDLGAPSFHIAPFWSDLNLTSNPHSGVYWMDSDQDGQRKIIVQWDKVDYDYQTRQYPLDEGGPMLPRPEQERGEELCSNVGGEVSDDDQDGAVDCADSSCACAVACGGLGCGLTFEAIIHVGLGMVEFRYLNSADEFAHALASANAQFEGDEAGTAIGLQQSGKRHALNHVVDVPPYGIDLFDGRCCGDRLTFNDNRITLDISDQDEQIPSTQRNIVLWNTATLLEVPELIRE